VTGLGTTISETEARAVGVDTLLQKPVDTSELAATLDALT
jgi:DNA-binding response OmpR family regulator